MLMIFYRQSTIIPILHYSIINLKETAFLIRYGLIDLMIISAKKKTLPLLYDPFFKKLFNGDEHRERLSRLVSSIIGQKVTVIDILTSES